MAESDFQVGDAVGIQSKQLGFQFLGFAVKPDIQTIVYSLTTSYGKFFANAQLETMHVFRAHAEPPIDRTTTTN